MPTTIKNRARELAPRLTDWRRLLHRRPELGFEEHETAAFLRARLEELGLELRTGIAETGIVALLRSAHPRGRAVLLRADMDALPIREATAVDHRSEIDGRMHACGHDGHMAMLLGAATLLVEARDRLDRDVLFCFQPGEEGHGGAARMIDEGVLDWVEVGSAYALHLWTPFAAGTVHVRPGPTMAAQDEFTARIVGAGGHGALPHAARDPVVAAAQAVLALQTIVSRSVDPIEPAVVSVGSIHGGSAPNVIPDDVVFEGTMRSFTEPVRLILKRRLREVLEGTAQAAGCRVELDLRDGYPATVNDADAAAAAWMAAVGVVGEDAVHEPAPLAAAEDFGYFLEKVPGAFVLVGAGNEAAGITAPHHSPRFDIDESVLPIGAELLARIALGI